MEWLTMFVEQRLIQDQGPLHYAVGPDVGSPLMLLHGVTRSWRDWLTLMPNLAARWRICAPDFRGHGQSARTDGRYFVRDYLEDAVALAQAQFSEPGVVFGHSLGALVALGLAATAPALVRAVVLEDPPAPRFVATLHTTPYEAQFIGMRALAGSGLPVAAMARVLADVQIATAEGPKRLGDLRDAASLRFSARCLQDLDPDVFAPLLERQWLKGVDIHAWAERLRCPVLLLRGNERLGGMLPPADADRLVAGMADVTRVDLPQVGHFIHLQEPAATLRLVVQFLESVR